MNKKIIIVEGYLASGKSTFALRLSDEINVPYLERVHINRNVRISKRIFRRTRRKFADVLYVLQEFSTKLCGKSAERRALSVNVKTL